MRGDSSLADHDILKQAVEMSTARGLEGFAAKLNATYDLIREKAPPEVAEELISRIAEIWRGHPDRS